MKLPKLFAITLTAALSAYLLHAAKPDSELQAKARAALEQTEIQPAPQPVSPPPAVTRVTSPAPVAQPPVQVITATPAPEANPEAVAKARMQLRATMNQLDGQLAGGSTTGNPGGLSPEASAKARELLRQTMAQLDAQPGGTPAVAPSGYVATPGMVRPVVTGNGMLSPEMDAKLRTTLHQVNAGMNSRLTPEIEAKARTTLHEAIAEIDMKDKGAPGIAARIKQERAAADKEVASTPTPAPQPVLSTLSGPKEKRLADLLALYKADTITPAEYHQERAKIIGEP